MPQVLQRPLREPPPPPPAPEQAAPTRTRRPPPPPPPTQAGPPTGRKISPLILASILIVVIVVGVVAVAVVWFNPFASPNIPSGGGGSCILATSAGTCQIGNGLYLFDLQVSTSSYANHPTYQVAFVINNTETTAVNLTTMNFDNVAVVNGLPSPDLIATSPFWVTYPAGHVINPRTELQLVVELPNTTSSGTHKLTLVDTAGNQYAFSFNI
jgi:hypothetical protein